MTDFWSEEQYRRGLMEEREQAAALHRLLAATRSKTRTVINPDNSKRPAGGTRLDKTIVLGGLRVRITAG